MSEKLAFYVGIAGGLIILGGLLWFLIRALQTGYIWDILAPFTCLVNRQKGLWPVLVILTGGLVSASPFIAKRWIGEEIDDRPKVEVKSPRDVRLTLTGAKPADFDCLKNMKSLKLLQWANPAVTDAHLELLRGMDDLEELDLNDTKITDAGLAIIATLPKLERLRIARTGITDEGFRTHILPLKHLEDLDLTLTSVKPATVREWTNAKLGRKRPPT
jgi:hypothetical protein